MFTERRQRVLKAMGEGAVAIVLGARPAMRTHDEEYPFRQDSDFWYLTGFEYPFAAAVLRTDGGPPFTLFVQPRDEKAELWTGRRPGIEGAREEYGADEAYASDELVTKLPELLEKAERIYCVLGRDAEVDRKLIDIQENLRGRSKLGLAPATQLLDPRNIVHEMRMIKQEAELDIMRRAADISREAHAEAARQAQPGRYEYELEATLECVFRRRGGSGPAYGSIVGGGANATVLHYERNDQVLRDGELVLIDAGAELESYASDVTRTYPVGGRFRGPGRALYEVVLAAQETALAACRPGTTLPEIHRATVRTMVEGMLGVGLLSGTVDDLIAEEAYLPYYMHGTSHWIGLDVHDVGAYARGDTHRSLEPGMVFSIEPGIYVSADAENAPAELRGIGVRIEDDVVITPDGYENLNVAIPRHPDDIEAWVRNG